VEERFQTIEARNEHLDGQISKRENVERGQVG
jgi:hypothetical protein